MATGGFGSPCVNVTCMTCPPLLAGPQLTSGALQTMWMSTKYAVPSRAKVNPNGF